MKQKGIFLPDITVISKHQDFFRHRNLFKKYNIDVTPNWIIEQRISFFFHKSMGFSTTFIGGYFMLKKPWSYLK
jgi:hypothetical protein